MILWKIAVVCLGISVVALGVACLSMLKSIRFNSQSIRAIIRDYLHKENMDDIKKIRKEIYNLDSPF